MRSLFRFAALRHPEHAATIERVLAIPAKRFERRLVTFLDEKELAALLAAVPSQEWLEIDGGVISALFNKANRR